MALDHNRILINFLTSVESLNFPVSSRMNPAMDLTGFAAASLLATPDILDIPVRCTHTVLASHFRARDLGLLLHVSCH